MSSARRLSPAADQRAEYHYLYYEPAHGVGGTIQADLSSLKERHRVVLHAPTFFSVDPLVWLARSPHVRGVVIVVGRGWLTWSQMRLVKRILKTGRRAWLYWPQEKAIEAIDEERLLSFRRLWTVLMAWQVAARLRIIGPRSGVSLALPRQPSWFLRHVDELLERAAPIPLPLTAVPDREHRLAGCGVYLRTDFWVRILSGGSYGHTCYVAKELAAVTERFVCMLPHRYPLLDEMGLEQVVMKSPAAAGSEKQIVDGTSRYYRRVKAHLETLRPAYLYERLCLGNYVGARLSRELGIPYFVEYNGSEISMKRSFGGDGYVHEDFYLKAELAAFRQATLISVVSQVVKDDLVARGVPSGKILVNPNGADPEVYKPPSPERKNALRAEFGWDDSHVVIGFTGTFGGWHGIDVLAAAIPRVCQQVPQARFLLIGDGNLKHLVDAAVERNRLRDRVRSVGAVPQSEGARLLGACDIYVSPHNRHMVDSPFFGSPTKIFEYMAMGGGMVASDLEQIGSVLSPAFRAAEVGDAARSVSGERAVLCTPGDTDEFVDAVVGLAKRADLRAALGRNARQAAIDAFSWKAHVARLWRGALEGVPAGDRAWVRGAVADRRLQTGDTYKDEAQKQWDNDPVGSHYVRKASPHTLEWYLEAEAYRYGEYAPWMAETMEFAQHAGERVLEIGGGMGTDLAQFAKHGAITTDVDLSAGHLQHAKENFDLRGLTGTFIHHDAEALPFEDDSFNLVYSNGVIHHTPNSAQLVREMCRVLKPGGRAIAMVYAENSLHYWYALVAAQALFSGLLADYSMGEIMSRSVEKTTHGSRPLVKVYTRERLRRLFSDFVDVSVVQRQLIAAELLRPLRWMSLPRAGELMGWNLIVKGRKPGRR